MPNFECKVAPDGESIELLIYAPIGRDYWGDGSMVDPRVVAKALQANKSAKRITLRINSPGGSAFDAFAIYEMLKSSNATVKAHIDGIAASAATVVMLAADEIEMNAAALMMIHRSSVGAFGHAEDLRQTAEIGDKIDQSLAKLYAARTGLAESEVVAMLYAETWFTADEALAKKFITSISPAKTVAASFDDSHFQNVPGRVAPILASLKAPVSKVEPMATQVATPAPEPTPATPVAAAPDVEKIKAEASIAERKRAADITALCAQARMPDKAQGFIESGASVADSQASLFKAVCEAMPPVGDEPPKEPVAKDDENAKYKAEFKSNPQYAKSMSEADYVAMRRIDDGLDTLKPADPAKK